MDNKLYVKDYLSDWWEDLLLVLICQIFLMQPNDKFEIIYL